MAKSESEPKMPPPWFVHTFWKGHRLLHRVSGGRFLWTPASKKGWGAARLTTTGRRSGTDRTVIGGYLHDGPSCVSRKTRHRASSWTCTTGSVPSPSLRMIAPTRSTSAAS